MAKALASSGQGTSSSASWSSWDHGVRGSMPTRRLALDGSGAHPIVVHLPAQHVAEQAFLEEGRHTSGCSSSRARPGLACGVPDRPGALPVDHKLGTILALLAQAASLCLRAPRADPRLGLPESARLLLQRASSGGARRGRDGDRAALPADSLPESEAGFRHMTAPVTGTASTRTELWHSLLEPAADRPGNASKAIWLRQGDGLSWSPRTRGGRTPRTAGTSRSR